MLANSLVKMRNSVQPELHMATQPHTSTSRHKAACGLASDMMECTDCKTQLQVVSDTMVWQEMQRNRKLGQA
jgi:hypothetical protein